MLDENSSLSGFPSLAAETIVCKICSGSPWLTINTAHLLKKASVNDICKDIVPAETLQTMVERKRMLCSCSQMDMLGALLVLPLVN